MRVHAAMEIELHAIIVGVDVPLLSTMSDELLVLALSLGTVASTERPRRERWEVIDSADGPSK